MFLGFNKIVKNKNKKISKNVNRVPPLDWLIIGRKIFRARGLDFLPPRPLDVGKFSAKFEGSSYFRSKDILSTDGQTDGQTLVPIDHIFFYDRDNPKP